MRLLKWLQGRVMWFMLSGLILATSLPLLQPEFFRLHDFVHAARIGEVLRGWQAGYWPVRWSEYFGFGYGMPLFQFYAPGPYYLGAVGVWLGLHVVTSLKLVFLLCNVVTVIGAYLVGKRLGGRATGLVVALLFVLAPYRAINLYVRGALSEAWAMAFFPWITLGIVSVIQRVHRGWLLLTGSLVGLLLSHNLSSLLFVPLSFIFASGWLWLSGTSRRLKIWFELVASYVLAAVLTAFYLIPAFFEKNATQVGSIVGGYFDYHLHFVYIRQLITPYWGYGGSSWGVEDGMSFFLGFAVIVGVGVVALGMAHQIWRLRLATVTKHRIAVLSLLGVLASISLVMSIGRSQLLWERVPLLEFVQFPWRWLSAASWWLALLVGVGVSYLSTRRIRLGVVIVLTVVSVAHIRYFQPEGYLEEAQSLYYTDPGRISRDMSRILMDYVPQGFDVVWAEQYARPVDQQVWESVPPVSEVTTLADRPHQRLLSIKSNQDSLLTLAIAAYPGWTVSIDGQAVNHQVTERGLLQFSMPAGEHLVGVELHKTTLQQFSDVLSGVAMIGLLLLLAFGFPSFKVTSPQSVVHRRHSNKRKEK